MIDAYLDSRAAWAQEAAYADQIEAERALASDVVVTASAESARSAEIVCWTVEVYAEDWAAANIRFARLRLDHATNAVSRVKGLLKKEAAKTELFELARACDDARRFF